MEGVVVEQKTAIGSLPLSKMTHLEPQQRRLQQPLSMCDMDLEQLRNVARKMRNQDIALDLKDEIIRRLSYRRYSLEANAFNALVSLNYIKFWRYDIPEEALEEVKLLQLVDAILIASEQSKRLGLPTVFGVREWLNRI